MKKGQYDSFKVLIFFSIIVLLILQLWTLIEVRGLDGKADLMVDTEEDENDEEPEVTITTKDEEEVEEEEPEPEEEEEQEELLAIPQEAVVVANFDDNVLSFINADDNELVGFLNVGKGPTDVLVSPNNKEIWVTMSGGDLDFEDSSDVKSHRERTGVNVNSVWVLDSSNGRIEEQIQVGTWPSALVYVDQQDYVIVANAGDDTITFIDTDEYEELETIEVGDQPVGIAIDDDQEFAFVTHADSDFISVIDLEDRDNVRDIDVGSESHGAVVLENNQYLYVTLPQEDEVAVVLMEDFRLFKKISVDEGPRGIVATPYSKEVFVVSGGTSSDPSEALSLVKTATNKVKETTEVQEGAYDAALSDEARYIYIANRYANSVSVFDTSDGLVDETISVGVGPVAVAFKG